MLSAPSDTRPLGRQEDGAWGHLQRRAGAAWTDEEYAAVIKSDLAKWGKVVKEAGIPTA